MGMEVNNPGNGNGTWEWEGTGIKNPFPNTSTDRIKTAKRSKLFSLHSYTVIAI